MVSIAGLLNPQQSQGMLGGQPALPRIPWGQNPMVTMMGMSMLGAPTLQQGLQNAGANAGAGMAAKVGMQRDMRDQQQTTDQRLAMNAGLKLMSGMQVSPEEQAALDRNPEVAFKVREMNKPPAAPTVETFYENGLPVKKQWNGSGWETIGGPKAADGTSLTVNPDGTVSFQQGEGVLPNGNQQIGRTASGDMQKQIDDLTIQKQQVERIGQLYDPSFLTYAGKARNAWAVTADKLGLAGPEDKAVVEKQTRFVQNVEQVFNLYRKDITGAAAALAELDRLKKAVINTDQSPAQFEASLGEFARTLARGLDIKKQLLSEGIPLGTTQFSTEFDQRFLSQSGSGTAAPAGSSSPSSSAPVFEDGDVKVYEE